MGRTLQTLAASRRHLLSMSGGSSNSAANNSLWICHQCRIKTRAQGQVQTRRGLHASPPLAKGASSYSSPALEKKGKGERDPTKWRGHATKSFEKDPTKGQGKAAAKEPPPADDVYDKYAAAHQLKGSMRAEQQLRRSKPKSPPYVFNRVPLRRNIGGGRDGEEDDNLPEALPNHLRDLVVSRIADHTQLYKESTVETGATLQEDLLVNMPELRANYDLWRTLFTFRRRLDGDLGVVDIYRGMRLRGIDLPTVGANADKIWDIVLSAAARDKHFYYEVEQHGNYLRKRGERWPGWYAHLVGRKILGAPVEAKEMHRKMVDQGHIPQDWGEFLINISREILKLDPPTKRASFFRLREIYRLINDPPARVYSTLIPFLGNNATISETYKWHKTCIANNDLPQDTSPADAIFEYLGLAGIMADIHALFDVFWEKQIPLAESSLCVLVRSRSLREDVMVMLIERLNAGKINKSIFGDDFWATVLAAKDLNINSMVVFMCSVGVEEMGPKALTALLVRLDSAKLLYTYVSDIRVRGIKVDNSLLQRLQLSHPTSGSSRTSSSPFAPASLASGQPILDKVAYDTLLTRHIKMNQLPAALYILGDMRAFSIPVRPNALFALVKLMLRPRRPGHAPVTVNPHHLGNDDLQTTANTLIACLRAGMFVPPEIWLEIFRRLGMEQKLSDLERLAVYLIDWYHPYWSGVTLRRFASGFIELQPQQLTTPPPPEPDEPEINNPFLQPPTATGSNDPNSISSSSSSNPTDPLPPPRRAPHFPTVTPLYYDPPPAPIPVSIRASHKFNPLRRLFPPSFFRAITEWGVLGMHQRPAVLTSLPALPPSPLPRPPSRPLPKPLPHTDEASPHPPPFAYDPTWGLRLAQFLAGKGVHVDPRIIRRALTVRARAIYGARPPQTRSKLNWDVRVRLRMYMFPTLAGFIRWMNDAWFKLHNPKLEPPEPADLLSTPLKKSGVFEQGRPRNRPLYLFSPRLLSLEPHSSPSSRPSPNSTSTRPPTLHTIVLGPPSSPLRRIARRMKIKDVFRWDQTRTRLDNGGRKILFRDRNGRWRLSVNERKRRGRLVRLAEGGGVWGG